MLYSICQQIGKLSNSHRTGKGKFSFQCQRNAIPKNAQITKQLHSSHMIAKWCSKVSKPDFKSRWTVNFQMFKLDLEKVEEQEIKLPTLLDHRKSQRVPERHLLLLSALLTMPMSLTVWIKTTTTTTTTTKKLENSSRDGHTRPLYLPPEKSVHRSRSNS